MKVLADLSPCLCPSLPPSRRQADADHGRREAVRAGLAAEEAEGRRPPRPHLLPDDPHDRPARGQQREVTGLTPGRCAFVTSKSLRLSNTCYLRQSNNACQPASSRLLSCVYCVYPYFYVCTFAYPVIISTMHVTILLFIMSPSHSWESLVCRFRVMI